MSTLNLLEAKHSQLVVIDVQERLVAAMPEKPRQQTLQNTALLTQAANTLKIPVTHTEQYPKGLGITEQVVRTHLTETAAIEKTCFSCFAAEGFITAVSLAQRQQIILCGMESHVCVMQTALTLHDEGIETFVVGDAVSSRHEENKTRALARMAGLGIGIVTVEMVLFEWLHHAGRPEFKDVFALIR